MSYPGNASLAAAVKDRVASTFQQTVGLYKQGRMDEVASGCALILQMDPQFEPARRLLEKTKNPALPLDVDSLLPPPVDASILQARQALAARDFEQVVHITSAILTNDLLNEEARILGDAAREKLEAAPFVLQFIRKSEQHIAAGNMAAAKMELEKARALDAEHSEVVRLSSIVSGRGTAPQPAIPSFVVDTPASPRAAAPAADFGFTFEEDKAPAPPADTPVDFSNFSFDSPSTPTGGDQFSGFSFDPSPAAAQQPVPPPPVATVVTPGGAAEFDFATASVTTSPEDQKKIDQYLADGDRAYDRGEYQEAIDFWSRIFLIDVTNDQASERIEKAKARRKEVEQKVEAALAAGIAAFERRDYTRARTSIEEALRLDPNNGMAQDYLEQIAAAPAGAHPPADEKIDLGFFEEEPMAEGYEAPLTPPPPAAAAEAKAAAGKKSTRAAGPKKKLPMPLIAAVLGALVILAAGWFAWSKFGGTAEVDPGQTDAIFARVSSLAEQGKFDQAIALLKDIKPGDPQHDRALVMMADLQQKKSTATQMIEGLPAAEYHTQKIAAARAAFQAHDYSGAKLAFEQAMRAKPLPPDAKSEYDTATQQVSKLDAAKALFAERKYADAVANLQQLQQTDPENKNIQRMIVDAHFNLGAMALQEERLTDAMREFDQVLAVNPDDELAKRSRDLAARYDGQPKDLLYRIYVKYLPLRAAG